MIVRIPPCPALSVKKTSPSNFFSTILTDVTYFAPSFFDTLIFQYSFSPQSSGKSSWSMSIKKYIVEPDNTESFGVPLTLPSQSVVSPGCNLSAEFKIAILFHNFRHLLYKTADPLTHQRDCQSVPGLPRMQSLPLTISLPMAKKAPNSFFIRSPPQTPLYYTFW